MKAEQLRKKLSQIEKQMQEVGFWQDKEKSREVQKEYSLLKAELGKIEKHNKGPAILTVKAGAGGRDADDWAVMVLNMYQKYCEKRNWSIKILSESFGEGGGPEGRIGIKEASIEVNAINAYATLKQETGVHRLVRISPFSSKKLRHTSFCSVEVLPKLDEVDFPDIRPDDLKIETFRATGHGGQNVNKRETAIRITHIPTGIAVSCQQQRQQAQNKKIALSILAAKLLQKSQLEKDKELKQIKGGKIFAEFGHQIRSYVLHPYKMVKDHRTQVETSNVEDILNGELDKFIEAEIKMIS